MHAEHLSVSPYIRASAELVYNHWVDVDECFTLDGSAFTRNNRLAGKGRSALGAWTVGQYGLFLSSTLRMQSHVLPCSCTWTIYPVSLSRACSQYD